MSGGLLCHPFSFQRQKTGRTPGTGPVEEHSEFDIVMVKIPELIKARRPGDRVSAQVTSIGHTRSSNTLS
jgi:hypothetical protein